MFQVWGILRGRSFSNSSSQLRFSTVISANKVLDDRLKTGEHFTFNVKASNAGQSSSEIFEGISAHRGFCSRLKRIVESDWMMTIVKKRALVYDEYLPSIR